MKKQSKYNEYGYSQLTAMEWNALYFDTFTGISENPKTVH